MVQTSFPSGGKIEVGGRNLLRNSDFSNGTNGWWGNRETHQKATLDGKDVIKVTGTSEVGVHWFGQDTDAMMETDVPYTLSGWVRTDDEVAVAVCFESCSQKGTGVSPVNQVSSEKVSGWRKLSTTGILPSSRPYVRASFRTLDGSENKVFYVYHPKLERGTIATDWTPAPEDILERLAKLESKVGAAADEPGDDNEVI